MAPTLRCVLFQVVRVEYVLMVYSTNHFRTVYRTKTYQSQRFASCSRSLEETISSSPDRAESHFWGQLCGIFCLPLDQLRTYQLNLYTEPTGEDIQIFSTIDTLQRGRSSVPKLEHIAPFERRDPTVFSFIAKKRSAVAIGSSAHLSKACID